MQGSCSLDSTLHRGIIFVLAPCLAFSRFNHFPSPASASPIKPSRSLVLPRLGIDHFLPPQISLGLFHHFLFCFWPPLSLVPVVGLRNRHLPALNPLIARKPLVLSPSSSPSETVRCIRRHQSIASLSVFHRILPLGVSILSSRHSSHLQRPRQGRSGCVILVWRKAANYSSACLLH